MNKRVVTTDSRNRITLPKAAGLKGGDYVELEVRRDDGALILTPVAFKPRGSVPRPQPKPHVARPLCMHRMPTGTLCALHAVAGSDFCRVHTPR
jgi:hypothetical protein